MKQNLIKFAIEAAARRNGGDPAYAMALYKTSPRALKRLGKVAEMLSHREAVPLEAAYAAQLVGALAEGCGSCVQIHINMARLAGVPDDVIEAVLRGNDALASPNAALAMRFARAIIYRSADEAVAREAVRNCWGEKGIIDLTMAAQVSRFLSMLKGGFGYATTCAVLTVGDRVVTHQSQAA